MRRVALVWLIADSVLCWAGWASDKPPAPIHDSAQAEQTLDSLPSYILGPDDQIMIRGIDLEEIGDKPIAVGTDGYISLPLLGRLKAAGMTVAQLETELKKQLVKYLHNPQLSVTISEFRSQPVSVIGSVKNPGIVQLQGRKTLVEVLSMAGGLLPDAGPQAKITRQGVKGSIPLKNCVWDPTQRYYIAEVNVKSIIKGLNPENNILILPNDIVSVPKADVIYVMGDVKKAGGFILNESETLSVLQVISLAEGFERTAALKSARILRGEPGTPSRTEIPVNLKDILAGKAPNLPLQSDDILFVPSSFVKSLGMRTVLSAAQLATYAAIYAH
jgi:polysaccharide biosynthesis/export protein